MTDAWPLIGRDEELANVTDVIINSGQQGVLIAGDSGAGKTRLALEALQTVTGDPHARWVARRVTGTASGRAVPLGAFARWMIHPEATGAVALGQVISALRAEAGDARLLVFVDDAHHLDELSALVVNQLAVSDTATVIATALAGASVSDGITALWKDGLLKRLELHALSRAETGRLLQAVLAAPLRADCADRLWEFTRGNVLFLRHLVEQERTAGRLKYAAGQWEWSAGPIASPSLTELVERHIGTVPAELRDVLDTVAVAEPIDRACLTEVVDSAALEAAEERGLIRSSSTGETIYIGHPLYGEVRRSRCSTTRLRRLRGLIAGAVAHSGKPSIVDPLRLGLLWLESDLPPDPEILSRAAAIARSRLDLDVAERLARAAVDANAGVATTLLLAYILFMREKGRETEDVLDDVGDQDARLTGFISPAILRAANWLWVMREPERSWDIIEEALRRRGTDEATDLRTFRAVQLSLAGRPAEAVDTMAGADYTKLDPFGRSLGLCAETLALADLGRVKEAVEQATRGYAVVNSAPQDSYQGTATAEFHAFALLAAGYVPDAIAAAEQRYQACVDLPGMIGSMATAVLGMAALGGGDLRRSLGLLEAASAGMGGYGDISGIFYRFSIARTEALARSGHVDAATAALTTTQRLRHPAYAFVESGYLLSEAWVAAVHGRITEAQQCAANAREFAHSHGQWAREVLCLQVSAQLGDGGGAERLHELEKLVEGPRVAICRRYASALTCADPIALEEVSHDFEAMGDTLAAADAAAHAAVTYRQGARRGSSLTARLRAQRLARDCGGAVSPALEAAHVGLPFTAREQEIAVLVANGLSNREIARATSLSVRTVEGHVLRATVKAGVANRSELAMLIAQRHDSPAS